MTSNDISRGYALIMKQPRHYRLLLLPLYFILMVLSHLMDIVMTASWISVRMVIDLIGLICSPFVYLYRRFKPK